MNRLHSVFAKALMILLLGSVAQADESKISPYLSLSGGYTLLEDTDVNVLGIDAGHLKFDDGYNIEGAIGIVYSQYPDSANLRAELAFSYQENDLDEYKDDIGAVGPPGMTYSADGEVNISALMINGYFDFYTDSIFSPYLLAGLGTAKVDAEILEDNVFAYQFGVGLGISLSENIILDLKYKYFQTEEPKESDIKMDIDSSQFMGGIRLQF